MRNVPCTSALGLALLAVLSSSGAMIANGGQTPQSAKQTASSSVTPPTTTDVNTPKLNHKQTPPPGKMRGLTNEMRWSAAIRSSNRKAHSKGNANRIASQSEVKQ
jgi:hypothetical protein